MIFVDANVPMYLVGAEHPNKALAAAAVERALAGGQRMITDVEVLQELLHRYTAIQRPEAIQPSFDLLLGLVDETFPVELSDVEAAKQITLGGYGLSARDALHIAVMNRYGVGAVMSFDRGYDRYPGLNRIG